MTDQQTVKVLSSLYRMIEAGEKGYAVSAANVANRGLKVLFKSYAQQRSDFGSEILAEMQRLGGNAKPGSSIRGVIHRGRINIFAALTIGSEERDTVILNEIILGERVALNTYEKALKKDLDPRAREIVARQYKAVRKVVEQIHLMRGWAGKRMIVRLFDSEKDADLAAQELRKSASNIENIEQVILSNEVILYRGRSTTLFETIISGAVGGTLWGSLIGALAGLGAEQTANLAPFAPSQPEGIWIWVALAGIVAGSFVGSALGFTIGIGISSEDTYLYDQSMKNGRIILLILTDVSWASEAGRILARLDIESRQTAKELSV